ncbi:hypothetical protein ABFX02_12G160800 [Erythranthe guttata]
MDEGKKAESHMASAAAFVEGGIQDACEDSCSICLEGFCDSDPSTVTSCKHEYHLQCILEWCQRSSSCPMCLRDISLKDPTSQELLEAVERERNFRFTPRNSTIFRHPTLGDFELQHLPVGVNDAELEDRIIQHLAAAAAMGRTRGGIARREGSRTRSSAHPRRHPYGSSTGGREEIEPAAASENNPRFQLSSLNDEATQHVAPSFQNNQISASSSRNYVNQSSLPNQDRAGPSEFQSWKSRINSMSMKYKESISKSTKELKEKLFSRNSSMADIGSEVRREVNAGIATVSRMMERLETRDNNNNNNRDASVTERSNSNQHTPNDSASLSASSIPS